MRKLNLAIALGLVLALVGAAMAFAYGRTVDDRIADGRRMKTVLVATEPLAAGTKAGDLAKSVETRKIPAAYAAKGTVSSLDQLPAMTLLGPVPVGGQLTASSFGRPQDLGVLKPSRGNVALAVGVELVPGVARYITAPSLVDLFVTYPQQNGGSAAAGRTKLFATGVKVLSVSVAPPPPAKSGGESSDTADQSGPANDQVVAVLDVSPDTAERIVNSATLGKLYLGLSSAKEHHVTPTGATPDDVVQANR